MNDTAWYGKAADADTAAAQLHQASPPDNNTLTRAAAPNTSTVDWSAAASAGSA